MMRILSVAVPVILAGLLFALLQPDAEGCASVSRSNRPEDSIRIAEESAVIVWDAKNKIEHFIRRAAFDTKSPDFGFLVPTPTMPILAEVKDRLFSEMDRWILPKTETRTRFRVVSLFCIGGCSAPSAKRGMATGSVRILAEQQVGGFNATVVEANDTDSLAKWIAMNGYSSDPELQSWLAPYVAAKWKITAFKIIQDPKTGQLASTKPVRMSFKTDRPFFPYREPAIKGDKQNHGSRLLRVFFVSDVRVEGKFGNNVQWHANVPWSDQLSEGQRKDVAKETGIAEAEMPAKAWMTAFEDPASPRPGKDEIFFSPALDRTPVRPAPFIEYGVIWIPAELILFGAFLVSLTARAIILKVDRTAPPPTPNRFSI